MPIYEYQCEACGHQLEALQKINESPLTECPACQRQDLKKLVSASAFRLGGSGWYETDFKSGNKKNLAGDNDNKAKSGDSGNAKPNDASPAKPKPQSKPADSGAAV